MRLFATAPPQRRRRAAARFAPLAILGGIDRRDACSRSAIVTFGLCASVAPPGDRLAKRRGWFNGGWGAGPA
jgi:hypothetical protein